MGGSLWNSLTWFEQAFPETCWQRANGSQTPTAPGVQWERFERPSGLDDREMTVASGIAELLAARAGAPPPPWTISVGGQQEPLFLDPGLEKLPRTLARTKSDAPEPLRKRNLFASPDFLDVK